MSNTKTFPFKEAYEASSESLIHFIDYNMGEPFPDIVKYSLQPMINTLSIKGVTCVTGWTILRTHIEWFQKTVKALLEVLDEGKYGSSVKLLNTVDAKLASLADLIPFKPYKEKVLDMPIYSC